MRGRIDGRPAVDGVSAGRRAPTSRSRAGPRATAPVAIAPRERVPEAGRLNRMAAVARMNGCDRDTADRQERFETFGNANGQPGLVVLDRFSNVGPWRFAMLLSRRSVTLGTLTGAAVAALVPDALTAEALGASASSSDDPQVVLDWERIVFRTVYPRRRSRSAYPSSGSSRWPCTRR